MNRRDFIATVGAVVAVATPFAALTLERDGIDSPPKPWPMHPGDCILGQGRVLTLVKVEMRCLTVDVIEYWTKAGSVCHRYVRPDSLRPFGEWAIWTDPFNSTVRLVHALPDDGCHGLFAGLLVPGTFRPPNLTAWILTRGTMPGSAELGTLQSQLI